LVKSLGNGRSYSYSGTYTVLGAATNWVNPSVAWFRAPSTGTANVWTIQYSGAFYLEANFSDNNDAYTVRPATGLILTEQPAEINTETAA
jgi:hypothetical protein